jgi:hypothetical protein
VDVPQQVAKRRKIIYFPSFPMLSGAGGRRPMRVEAIIRGRTVLRPVIPQLVCMGGSRQET